MNKFQMVNKKTKKINIKAFGLTDQIFFAQRLSLLLNSNISIVEALTMMKNIDESLPRKYIYEILIGDIEKGISLSKSIKNTKLKINDLLFVLIQNGEEGGNLSEALLKAFHYLEKKNDLKKKIVSSLVYPCFIVIATICMTLFLILYIFPKIIPLLSSLNIKLPLMTRIVQSLYNFIISYGMHSVILCSFIFLIYKILIIKNKHIRYKIDTLVLSITAIKKYYTTSFCIMGEMILSSGKSLPDLAKFLSNSSQNTVYRDLFNKIYIESTHGISLSESLKKYNRYFPSLLLDMCTIGEKTGSLGVMLGHCGRIFEQDMENILKRFSSLIEPVLMIFMGLIVGSIALSIILPVYEITNHLSK